LVTKMSECTRKRTNVDALISVRIKFASVSEDLAHNLLRVARARG
jgi:hypothetical protein